MLYVYLNVRFLSCKFMLFWPQIYLLRKTTCYMHACMHSCVIINTIYKFSVGIGPICFNLERVPVYGTLFPH